MPSPPSLDIDALTAPIPGDEPAGSSVPFALREALDTARKEINPDDYPADDPTRPTEYKKADWPGIVRQTTKALTETSKDLMLAARLTEAVTRVNGYAGVRDGLAFLKALVENGWDRIRPEIDEDGDVEPRAAAFNWLDDPDRGARFPNTIRGVPIVFIEGEPFSFQDWRQIQSGKGKVTTEQFDKAVSETPRDRFQTLVDDLAEAREVVAALLALLNEKMGYVAPGLTSVRGALEECWNLNSQILDRKGPAPVEAGGEEVGEGEGGGEAAEGGGGGGGGGRMTNRVQVYQRLAEAAAVLEKIEPTARSPS